MAFAVSDAPSGFELAQATSAPASAEREGHRATETATRARDERHLAGERELIENAHRPSSCAARMNAPTPL